MTTRNYSNTAVQTTLVGGITSGATLIQVAATTGFPSADFVLALDADAATQELVLVTNVAGTTLTVTRGYDGTTAQAHNSGAVVVHSHAAIEFREANTHVNASTDVHGLAGGAAVVGTTSTQTLTNKTLSGAVTSAGGSVVGTTDTQTLTNKTISRASNTIGGFTSGKVPIATFDGSLVDGQTGPGSPIVGTTDTQTLTNKTIALGSNTVSGTLAQFNTAVTDANLASLTGTETLTNKTLSTGTKVGAATTDISTAWASYSPTTSITLGNGTLTGAYMQIGKTVHFRLRLEIGSTTSVPAGTMTLGLPVAESATANGAPLGVATATDDSVANTFRPAILRQETTTTFSLLQSDGARWGQNTPWTWAVSDTLYVNGTYEVT